MPRVLDVQKLRLLDGPDAPAPDGVLECDLLVAGGGMGGCAAALAACRAGRAVVLTEETDWIGGQLTSQGVSALDEHRHIESFGGTRSYYELRRLLREFYREHAALSPSARAAEALNPGNGWVSRLCFEPRAALWALEQLLLPFEEDGRLTVLLRHRAVAAEVEEDTVATVTFRHLDGEEHVEIRAAFVLDATELGDLLPLTGTEYVSGAESAAETGEPSARSGPSAPACVQSFTYPFVLELRPGERHAIRRPDDYEENRERQPYTLRHLYHDERGWVTYRMFETGEGAAGPFWTYRRLIHRENFADRRFARDLAMINWPGNDFRRGSLTDVEPEAALDALRRARSLSLGFCHWLQTECPRDEGGEGYPELHLRPDVMGTEDGLSRYPYIRESRRIRALRTVVETDISARAQPGARARLFPDSVGIGLYAIDIHPAEGEEKIPPDRARPFQIPLPALIPVRMQNLLPACKNIGTTHITNGAYRLHPVEWNIGEAAAQVALFCLDRNLSPHAVLSDSRRQRRLQRRLVRSGVPLHWYADLPLGDPLFEAAQTLAGWGVWTGDPDSLELRPEQPVGSAELRALSEAPRWAREGIQRVLPQLLSRWASLDRRTLLRATYEVLSL
jgi:hypothetical protein